MVIADIVITEHIIITSSGSSPSFSFRHSFLHARGGARGVRGAQAVRDVHDIDGTRAGRDVSRVTARGRHEGGRGREELGRSGAAVTVVS